MRFVSILKLISLSKSPDFFVIRAGSIKLSQSVDSTFVLFCQDYLSTLHFCICLFLAPGVRTTTIILESFYLLY